MDLFWLAHLRYASKIFFERVRSCAAHPFDPGFENRGDLVNFKNPVVSWFKTRGTVRKQYKKNLMFGWECILGRALTS